MNRRQYLLRLGCGENEFDVAGRLFEKLQKRIERLGREHMHFVDDVDFEPCPRRPVNRVFDKVADVIYSPIRCPVDFDYVDILAEIDRDAAIAFAAGFSRWLLR